MAYLEISRARKEFAGFVALHEVSLEIGRGEFFTLLGPSGCGKTTLLRAVAGFAPLTSGEIRLEGRDLRGAPPHRRDIGMVFQDHALFPHLSVFENVAFGLKARKVPSAEVEARVAEALESVRLRALAERLPAALSGGQQQRVGVARAMAIRPRLLLMDEPLSNLDARLRLELREEIRSLQKGVGAAALYVTHDQEEALAISDRIGVMRAGRLEQTGTPQEIYGDPRTRFVAEFVGALNGFAPSRALEGVLGRLGLSAPGAAFWAIRPERLRLLAPGAPEEGAVALSGRVERFVYLGREAALRLETDLGPMTALIADPGPRAVFAPGETARIAIPKAALMAFDASGARLKAEP